MNRRLFLTRLGQAIAVAAVAVHVPIEWVPRVGGARDTAALDYLRHAFNAYAKGKPWPQLHNTTILVGQRLFEKVEDEIGVIERFSDDARTVRPILRFKGCRLMHDNTPTWGIVSMTSGGVA